MFMIINLKGNIIVIVNGKVLLDEVIPFFRNSFNVRPASLKGKKWNWMRKSFKKVFTVKKVLKNTQGSWLLEKVEHLVSDINIREKLQILMYLGIYEMTQKSFKIDWIL